MVGKFVKKLIFILLFSFSVFPQKGQETPYSKGLRACLDKEFASYAKFSERNLRSVFVEHDFYLTRELPTQLGETKVQYLSDSELIAKYKLLSKADRERGVPFIKIFPLSEKEDKLMFAYNNYWITYSEKGGFFSQKKAMYRHALEGGCHAHIGFDPIQKRFVIEKVELWGV